MFFVFLFFKKKVKKGLQEMVSFICLIWVGLICSRMFQGGEEKAQAAEVYSAQSPSLSSSPSTESAAYLLAELNLGAAFSSGLFGSGAGRES